MRRDSSRLILRGPGLTALMAIVVVLAGLRSSADEPPSTEEAAKKIEAKARMKDAAFKAAESYLVLLDKGKFAESWEASSEDLRKGLQQRKWVEALNKTRRPFGRLRSRKLNRIELRGSEDPEKLDEAWVYSDLKSTSGLTTNELAIVTLEKGKDWKVSAYFIGDPDNFPKPLEDDDPPKPAEKKEAKESEKRTAKTNPKK
jgi:hypothetical protein